MLRELRINDRIINDSNPVFIIAEIGINHQGSLDIAKKLIVKAKESGADAVKFQKRSINRILTREGLKMPYDNRNSFGKTYGEHKIALELFGPSIYHRTTFKPIFEQGFNKKS